MPFAIIIALLCAVFAIDHKFNKPMVGELTLEQYAAQCQAKGGAVLLGLTDTGNQGIGCYNIRQQEIKMKTQSMDWEVNQ